MNDKQEVFKSLRKRGHRITPQREEILQIFTKIPEGHHLSAIEIQNLLQEHDLKISLATLYRTLKFLTLHGFLRELDFGEDHKHYELKSEDKSEHHHLICNMCGSAEEFDNNELMEIANNICDNQTKFRVLDYQFKIFGICEKCLKASAGDY
ncbi:MAG: Fur family transcriptional regulator [bacterium]